MYLKLIREKPDGKAVRGKLYVAKAPCPSWEKGLGEKGYELLCSTLENLDYLIPALIYPLTVTYSPKFKRPLPLVSGVPKDSPFPAHRAPFPLKGQGTTTATEPDKDTASAMMSASHVDVKEYRSGIRFHPGTKPEHSRGCILVSREAEEMLKKLILGERETRLEIN